MLQLERIARALKWLLFSEFHTKKVKEKLPIPNEVVTNTGHLIEDVQLGTLILKLPLGIGLALAPLHTQTHQALFLGLGLYFALDFLFQYIEQSRGEETWHQCRYGTLAIEILGVFGLSLKAVSEMTEDSEVPGKLTGK